MFRFMDKHRVTILMVVLLAMVGFGGWGLISEWVAGSKGNNIDPTEVWATATVFGEKKQIDLEAVSKVTGMPGFEGNQDTAAYVIGQIVRELMANSDYGYPVATDEVEIALRERFQEPVRRMNGGKWDSKVYAQFVGDSFRMTPGQFESRIIEDLRLAKTFRELARAGSLPSMKRILEIARRDNKKVELQGIFWDSASFTEAAKLARDGNDNLTAEAIAELREYFDGLSDDEKRALGTKGALLTLDFIGYDFSLFADDQAFLDDFSKVNATSGKSLEQITAAIEISPEDLTVMKERLDRNREIYGLKAEDVVDEVFAARKSRFEAEVRVIKLVRDLWSKADGLCKTGEVPDLAKIAAENNLVYFEWRNRYLKDLTKEGVAFQSSDLYQLQLPTLTEGNMLDLRYPPGSTTMHFGAGAVDIIGRHVAAFRMEKRNMQPAADFNDADVREILIGRYETKRAADLRDEAFDSFQDKMNAVCDEMGKEKIDEIKAQIEKDIAEAIKDLDPEKEEDKAKIDQIKADKAIESEVLVDDARSEYRNEAFDRVLAENPDLGLVIKEGFFRPFDSVREQPVDRQASFEARARSSLRREFKSLHDQTTMDIFIEPGTVSDVVVSPSFPGLKGIAKLVAKKEPTDRELLIRPNYLNISMMNAARALQKERGSRNLWTYEAMQERNFDVDSGKFKAEIEKTEKRAAEAAAKRAEFEAKQRMMREQKGREAGQKNPDEMTDAEKAAQRALGTVPNKN